MNKHVSLRGGTSPSDDEAIFSNKIASSRPKASGLAMTLLGTVQFILLCFLFLFLVVSFTQKINLTTADLGRHIKNGQIFFERHQPISTNFYSYTETDYPTVNHHWLTGVFFFLMHRWWGFEGVSFFYTCILLFSSLFFFLVSKRTSNFSYALFFSLLSAPLIASRLEVRPEGLSCLFLGVYYYLLTRFKEQGKGCLWLWIIPALQILWVNSHILFFLGPLLIAFFFLDSWCNGRDPRVIRQYAFLGLATLLACFINPFGLKGVLTPLTIFKEYGYRLAENQSVIFMHKRFPENPLYLHFEILFAAGLLSLVYVCFKNGIRKHILNLFLFGFFSLLAWKAIRGIQMFGLFFIPLFASSIYSALENHPAQVKRWASTVFLFLLILLLGLSFIWKDFYFSPYFRLQPGKLWGLRPGVNQSAEFLKQNKIKGPIFNNYDIGGYLIYHLFPNERVFVDNRPEAYSVDFFKNIYVPMQEDETVWEKMVERYQFNAIYFFRLDITPWAQPFLIRRISDPSWAPVFVDDTTIILLKRNERNAKVIQLYELPKSIFGAGR